MRSLRAIFMATIAMLIACESCYAIDEINGWTAPSGRNNYGGYLGWLGYNSASYPWHLAQDMANPAGDPVYAIGDGTIILSRTDVGGYGPNFTAGGAIVIRHQAADGSWFTALYGHLNSPHAVGAVNRGDIVGYSNNFYYMSGGVAHYCPHVHFGIHPGYDAE
ncbi:MAG: M23 family metallopeptidase, partial [Armatimonadia bacterium]